MKSLTFALLCALMAIASARSSRCIRSSDCGPGECCLNTKLVPWFRGGRCTPLSKVDEACSRRDYRIGFFQRVYVNKCPCAPGLSCKPTREQRLPFGMALRFGERCVSETSTTIVNSTPDEIKINTKVDIVTTSVPEDVTTNEVLETEETEVVTEEGNTETSTNGEEEEVTASIEDNSEIEDDDEEDK